MRILIAAYIILLTGRGEKGDIVRGLEAGAKWPSPDAFKPSFGKRTVSAATVERNFSDAALYEAKVGGRNRVAYAIQDEPGSRAR